MVQNAKTVDEVLVAIRDMQSQLIALGERVAQLEACSGSQSQPTAVAAEVAPKPVALLAPVKHEITEEEILAVSAALGAYLGVRIHIRQMRLLSSSAWAQQGRVSIQAHIPYTH